jgi:hypothetical protein
MQDVLTPRSLLAEALQFHEQGHAIPAACLTRIALELRLQALCDPTCDTRLNKRRYVPMWRHILHLHRQRLLSPRTRHRLDKAIRRFNQLAHGQVIDPAALLRALRFARWFLLATETEGRLPLILWTDSHWPALPGQST